jgi:hypothetical protein
MDIKGKTARSPPQHSVSLATIQIGSMNMAKGKNSRKETKKPKKDKK